MKIQYCSDLHLEFEENKKFLKQNPIKPVGDILIGGQLCCIDDDHIGAERGALVIAKSKTRIGGNKR